MLPGASRPNKLFDQPEHEGKKLQYLVKQGYEIGNHTLWHANLGKYDEATVRAQVAEAQVWVQRHVPDYQLRTLALPHGVYPQELRWVQEGSAKGTTYRTDGILMVAGGAAPSPFAKTSTRSGSHESRRSRRTSRPGSATSRRTRPTASSATATPPR